MLGGTDSFLFPLVVMGGAGAICAIGAPVHRPLRRDDRVRPRREGRGGPRPRRGAAPGREGACFAEPNPSVFKGVLQAQGRIPTPDLRLPLVSGLVPIRQPPSPR